MKVTGKCFILEHKFWGEDQDNLDGPSLYDETVYTSKKLLSKALLDLQMKYDRMLNYNSKLTWDKTGNFAEWTWKDKDNCTYRAVLTVHKVPMVVELED